MKFCIKLIVLFFLLLKMTSCNNKLFVNKQYIIQKQEGLMVFIDREFKKDRRLGTGDLYTMKDSLIPDFFIPYNFQKQIITKKQIEEVLFSKKEYKASFFYFIRDCNNEERKSSINRECLTLSLDNEIDNYTQSNKIFVQPAVVEFIKERSNRDYFDLHQSITLRYKEKSLNIRFNEGYLDILRTNVLEYKWD